MTNTLSPDNFRSRCDILAKQDADLKRILEKFGYPPLWSRPNSFETLVHIILEQQVSLASAKAALEKLRRKLGEIAPEGFLLLSDEELRQCYFSRQKSGYVRSLAEAIVEGKINLADMRVWPEENVRAELIKLKGIGNWTIDIYLMFSLHHADIFPMGDLAVIQAMKEVKQLQHGVSRETLWEIAAKWQPHRTVASMMLWHYYLSVKEVNRKKTTSTEQT